MQKTVEDQIPDVFPSLLCYVSKGIIYIKGLKLKRLKAVPFETSNINLFPVDLENSGKRGGGEGEGRERRERGREKIKNC